MEVFELILVLAAAVLLSAVLEQLIPKVSLPLVQIALGVLFAVCVVTPIQVNFNPDFFLVVFIAPLLFHDSKHADKLGMWKNRGAILSLAIGLVLAIVLAVGFSVHWLIPSIPLAAALALGAALGPTDAVAVTSLGEAAELDRKTSALLSGEALLNDATGVVSFQFAIAAAVTGSFSLLNASVSFVIAFFGGILFGLILGWLAHFIQSKMSELGLDSITFHVLFDVTLPFIIYLFSEVVGVSGILAVVAAGLLLSNYTDRVIGPSASRLSIVSDSVWSVLTFTLNGIVFVLLGMQLPRAMQSTWDNVGIDNLRLIGYVLLITAILVLVRFVWIELIGHITRDPETHKRRFAKGHTFHSALVATIGGPKGAVTLSVIFSTPLLLSSGESFPQRDLIIFLASGVILCTLLLANFILPVLAPKEQVDADEREQVALARVAIMRAVIERLAATRTRDNKLGVARVIESYNDRIDRIQDAADIESASTTELRLDVIYHQQDYILGKIDEGEIDEVDGYNYLRRLSQAHNYLRHRNDGGLQLFAKLRQMNMPMRFVRQLFRHVRMRFSDDEAQIGTMAQIQLDSEKEAVRYLHTLLDGHAYPPEVVTGVLLSYQKAVTALERTRPGITIYAKTSDGVDDVERVAYNFELDEIQQSLDRGEINRAEAKEMRDNVYLMLVDLDAYMT